MEVIEFTQQKQEVELIIKTDHGYDVEMRISVDQELEMEAEGDVGIMNDVYAYGVNVLESKSICSHGDEEGEEMESNYDLTNSELQYVCNIVVEKYSALNSSDLNW